MNASEFAYWYRHGHGPLFGADLSKKPSPFAVAAHAVQQAGRGVGQVVRTVTPKISWSAEQRADIKEVTQKATQPFAKAARGVGRGVQQLLHPVRGQISFADPTKVSPYVSDEEASQISFGPSPSASAEAVHGELYGLFVESGLDEVDLELEDLEEEAFGIIPALIIGAASAAPALLLAIKGKKGRLKALEKKLEKLEEKAEGVDGKKKARLEKKIDKIKARIDKLKDKLGIEDEEEEEKEEKVGAVPFLLRHRYGLGPGLGSTYTFVPASLEPDDSPYAMSGEEVSPSSGRAVEVLSARWIGRSGVVQIRDDMWREGPVIVVSTLDGLRPGGFPRRVDGMKVVFVRSGRSPSYGSIPETLMGTHQLWPADAATVDGGTIAPRPIVPDHELDPSTEDAVRAGVGEFLQEYERRKRWSAPRR